MESIPIEYNFLLFKPMYVYNLKWLYFYVYVYLIVFIYNNKYIAEFVWLFILKLTRLTFRVTVWLYQNTHLAYFDECTHWRHYHFGTKYIFIIVWYFNDVFSN